MQTALAELRADPSVVVGFDSAAALAGGAAELGERMSSGHLPFLEIDGEYVFIRSSFETTE